MSSAKLDHLLQREGGGSGGEGGAGGEGRGGGEEAERPFTPTCSFSCTIRNISPSPTHRNVHRRIKPPVWRNEDTGAKIRQQKTREKVMMAEYMEVKSMRSGEIRAIRVTKCYQ
jgi:hypothetical protein